MGQWPKAVYKCNTSYSVETLSSKLTQYSLNIIPRTTFFDLPLKDLQLSAQYGSMLLHQNEEHTNTIKRSVVVAVPLPISIQ